MKSDQERKVEWENGRCPYCGREHIKSQNIVKKIRGYKELARGIEYRCEVCESINQFTLGGLK